MTTITFDTLQLTTQLRQAGFDLPQAEAVVRVLVKAQEGLVTREHFDHKMGLMQANFDAKMGVMEAKFDKLSWMLGILIALAIANFAKQFF